MIDDLRRTLQLTAIMLSRMGPATLTESHASTIDYVIASTAG
jgi:hypothetical protein